MSKEIQWAAAPPRSDLEAAFNYLSLLMPDAQARRVVAALRRGRPLMREAKDVLRASDLELLDRDELKVKQELKKLKKGEPLTPVLLVRGRHGDHVPLVIADGYHRLCAACHYDESAPVACRLAA